MEKQIKLYTYQKNTDLHCLSAFATIKEFLKCESISKCRRFIYWDITADCNSETELMDKIVSKSYYLLNTNKEDYYINTIPLTTKDNNFHVNVIVNSKISIKYDSMIEKINTKCNVKIKQLDRSVLWSLTVTSSSYDDAVNIVSKQLLGASNEKHPLLLNPIFETYQLCNS